ncbi:MAG: hypothetical protein ACK5MY_12860 [Jhaorihella sp.]
MSLSVHPDPQHPAGGFAFLELPGGSLPDASVPVAVQEAFAGRWLAPQGDAAQGDSGQGGPVWQGTRHDFGPYDVHRHDGADWVRIGPEIVDRVEEYTRLRIAVGGQVNEVTWPDDVPPRAGAAVSGAILSVAPRHRPDAAPAPAAAPPEVIPVPVAPPEVAQAPAQDAPAEPRQTADETPPAAPGKRIWLAGLAVLILLAALAAWFFLLRGDPAMPRAEAAAPVPERCSWPALSAVSGGFEAVEAALRDCGADVSPDTALRLIENAAARGDARALLLFGTLYDGAELDARIENLVGLTFEDEPARAAEYYARARAAGSQPARDRLSAICARLAGSALTLEKGAYDDYCR